jgi:hypothetical protein
VIASAVDWRGVVGLHKPVKPFAAVVNAPQQIPLVT